MAANNSSLYHEDSDLMEWKAQFSGEATMHRGSGIQEIHTLAFAGRMEVFVRHAFISENGNVTDHHIHQVDVRMTILDAKYEELNTNQ